MTVYDRVVTVIFHFTSKRIFHHLEMDIQVYSPVHTELH